MQGHTIAIGGNTALDPFRGASDQLAAGGVPRVQGPLILAVAGLARPSAPNTILKEHGRKPRPRPQTVTPLTRRQDDLKAQGGYSGRDRLGVNNARHEGLNRRVRLIVESVEGFDSANAVLGLIMLTLGPIEHVLPHERRLDSNP